MCEGCVEDGSISAWLYEIMEAFVDRYEDSPGSAAHIVVADCNVADSHIRFCLDEAHAKDPERGFLLWLLSVSENERAPNLGPGKDR